jgi:hypothetical protein
MKKFKVVFSDVFEAEDELNAYDGLIDYLRDCVKMEDVSAFGFDEEKESDELVLSDYEKGYLTAFYETEPDIQKDHADRGEDNLWYGIQVGERMFDLCVWKDDDIVCVVYECFLNDGGFWNTDTSKQWFLKEANNE